MFWVGLSLGKVIGIAAVGLIVLIAACLGCHKPTFSLVNIDASKAPRTAIEEAKNTGGAAKLEPRREPECTGDFVECDPVWQQLQD